MIYLVTKNRALFDSENYTIIDVKKSLELLTPLKIVSADTETEGLDPYTKKLLSVQLGCDDFQVVIDCLTINIHEYKEYLESDRLFIFWNAAFDLKFFYHQRIIIKHVYDGMLAEKLLWLGYPAGEHGASLKEAGYNYLGIELDKSVRGQIITKGLTDRVVVYAADDVKYEEAIREKQLEELKQKDLLKALEFENEFVKVLAYIEYCGVHLDIEKWKEKMKKDSDLLSERKRALDDYVIEFYATHKDSDSRFIITDICFKTYDKNTLKTELATFDEKLIVPNSGYTKEENSIVSYYCKLKVPYPFVYKDLQGDLFSGFDDSFKCNINWNSPQQVIPFLNILGVKTKVFDKKTKTTKNSTDAKFLESQADKFPFLKLFIKYKEAQKVVSTYGENFLNAISPITHRIHTNFYQFGTDTGRLSSGGGTYKINMQNLPHDAETRACFTAMPGNKWISCDYTGQESYLIASIANDPAMIDLFKHGCGDIHSLVAKMSYPKEIGNTPVEEIKEKFKELRNDAKGIEFGINYGGSADTIAQNKGIPIEEAKIIYNNYMAGFPGVKKYQDFRRHDFLDKGYILLSSVTGHKSFIPKIDYMQNMYKQTLEKGFWKNYALLKESNSDPELLADFKNYFALKSDWEKASINYPIQGAGALCFKLASIKFFNYLVTHDLLFKVLYVVPVHDELNIEAPAELAEEIAKVVIKCMEDGAKPFCTRLKLSADVSIEDYWVH